MMRGLLAAAVVLSWGGGAVAIEEPAFEVLEVRDGYEVRRYAAYRVAETSVDEGPAGGGSEGFRRLFGYISGRNRASESAASEKIEMTAPVISAPAQGGGATYQFVMPAAHTLDSLPRPDDPRVRIREVPPRTVAAVRYSGRWTEENFLDHRRALLQALERDGVVRRSEPELARYDAPYTPWFMRRNEILVEIEP